jgi:UDP-N-acetyl-D-galactosamine dehydrogenase
MKSKDIRIGIIGLGYVGLPLAVEFAKKFSVKGFDIKDSRISELKNFIDVTYEVSSEILREVIVENQNFPNGLTLFTDCSQLVDCNFFVITVPTPVDINKNPDLNPLKTATINVGKLLKKDDIVVYESTVYPGVTEEILMPLLEEVSGLTFNKDFYCGYSPERVNPGDKERNVRNIVKITSGSTKETALKINYIYDKIVQAGTFMVDSIKVAEAAKVIENAQRDINIAFVNELSKIFNLIGIDTKAVLDAASTKWNFLPFKPGLVGGHCIGVDPYYLAQRAQEYGYHPEIILSGRRINDSMGSYVAVEVIKLMAGRGLKIKGSRVLLLGITFKENCPDIRNSKVFDIIEELQKWQVAVEVYDPWVNKSELNGNNFTALLVDSLELSSYSAIILAVSHSVFSEIDFNQIDRKSTLVYDVKSFLNLKFVDARL